MSVVYLRSNPVSPDPRVEKEVNSLLKVGHKVTVLAWDRTGDLVCKDNLNMHDGDAVIFRYQGRAGFGNGFKTLPTLLKFQFFLLFNLFKLRKEYKVIHAADFDTILPAIVLKFLLRKKVVYDVYDFYVDAFSVPRLLKKIIKRIDLYVMELVDAVIITNESRFEQIKGSTPKRICVIHNTPDFSKSLTSLSNKEKSDGNFLIKSAYVGILQPHRLIEQILDVFSRHPDWRLDLAGFGVLESLVKEYAEKYPNIFFHGRVSYSDALSINFDADILFATYDPNVPNHKYSSPNKLYEAMLLAKPLVVCNSTGIDKLVDDEGIGFSIDYSGVGFEKCFEHILNSKVDLVSAGRKARALYDEKYSWSQMESVLYQLYDDILECD